MDHRGRRLKPFRRVRRIASPALLWNGTAMRPSAGSRPIPITTRFLLVIALGIGAGILTLIILRQSQLREVADLRASETAERRELLSGIIDLNSQALRDFARDWGQWDDMVKFIREPTAAWAAINIDNSLDNFKLAAAWVVKTDGTPVYAGTRARTTGTLTFPFTPAEMTALFAERPANVFFHWQGEQLLELCLSPIVPSADFEHKTPAQGWLLAARTWDGTSLHLLENLLRTKFTVHRPGTAKGVADGRDVALHHPLKGRDGRVIAELHYVVHLRALEITRDSNDDERLWFLLSWIFGGVLAIAFMYGWIVRPLRAITASLESDDPALIRNLAREAHEFGRVAKLVESSFLQRKELAGMLADRERLGRELHDGVIQTVYASGMSLAAARGILATQPAEAERILDEIRNELNRAIRDLRSFIAGLEPEPSGRLAFGPAIESIISLMRAVRPMAFEVDIDADLAARLGPSQQLQLLHIAREAISNSVRHSRASRVQVSLRKGALGGTLLIADDGTGLDPAASRLGTGGLANVTARARELGGTSEVTSPPNGGTQVRVDFPPEPATV